MKKWYKKLCKSCEWKNSDDTCPFSECNYTEKSDDWDGDIPGQIKTKY